MKVAICSSDGLKVDMHFGKTRAFYIYDFNDGQRIPIDKREVEKYSPIKTEVMEGTNVHPFLNDKFNVIYNSIKDCGKIFTTAIGDTPRKKLEEKGIEVEVCMCDINWIPTDHAIKNSSNNKYFLS